MVVRRASDSRIVGLYPGGHSPLLQPALMPARRAANTVFWVYLLVAASALSYVALEARRFTRSITRLRACAAQQDSACVSSELEAERGIHPTDVHVQLGDASLAVLLHDPDRARATVVNLEEAQKRSGETVSTDVRADLLLLKGDIAIAKSERRAARESVEAARLLLSGTELSAPRSRRIDKLDKDSEARVASGLDALKTDFTSLIDAAARGNRESTELNAQKAIGWFEQVTDNGARRALQLSLDSARRACAVFANEQLAQNAPAREPPRPPTRTRYDTSYGYGSFDDRMAQYRERLAHFGKEQAALEELQRNRTALAYDAGAAAIQQSRQQLDSALLTLSALTEPLSGAPGTPSAAALRPGYVQARPIVSGPVYFGAE